MSICSSVIAFLEGAKEAHYEHLCETGKMPDKTLNYQASVVDRYWLNGTYGEQMGAVLGNMIRPVYFLLDRKRLRDI